MNHPDLVFTGNGDHLLEEFQVNALAGGIAGEIEHQHFRLGPGFLDRPLQLHEEIHPFHHGHMADIGVGNHETIGVDRVTGVGHQYRISGPHGGQRQVCQPFLGPDGDNGLVVRIQVHVIATLIPVGNRLAQARDAT